MRGGRRPGAGAPIGNTNAAKHPWYRETGGPGTAASFIREVLHPAAGRRAPFPRFAEDLRRNLLLAENLLAFEPGETKSIKSAVVSSLRDLDPRIWNRLEKYDKLHSIKQRQRRPTGPIDEPILAIVARLVATRPRALDPALAARLQSYTGSHCPNLACCLVLDIPCAFDKPWPHPHPLWLPPPGSTSPAAQEAAKLIPLGVGAMAAGGASCVRAGL